MPALSLAATSHDLVIRNASAVTSNGSDALQVICAWPVSGQYGPGTRILYYVLVAACVFARKAEWLKNAVLAAALLIPAVAAIHGIVLAAFHIDGAVDMDIFGAFQVCTIGILAAPVTVKLSGTYFNDPGRNTIFLWTLLILAGLLALVVEFFRASPTGCPVDESGGPVSNDASEFPYGILCGLTCSVDFGPFSYIRNVNSSVNNIYVIPAPEVLSLNTASLLAAACCVPAVLSLVTMWNKILESNWKVRFGKPEEQLDVPIEGTNGATQARMNFVNLYIRRFLRVVEVPVFGAAILYLLINGERNFSSPPVIYQTEPISSVGQWAPIAGTVLAILGSLYLLLSSGLVEAEEKTDGEDSALTTERAQHQCCGNCRVQQASSLASQTSSHITPAVPGIETRHSALELMPTMSLSTTKQSVRHRRTRSDVTEGGHRIKVAERLIAIGNRFGTAAPNRYDDSEFKHGKAADFPLIPGEENRSSELPQIMALYNHNRGDEGSATPALRKVPSKAGSFTGSVASQSPRLPGSPSLSSHRTVSRDGASSLDLQRPPASHAEAIQRVPRRRDTLEAPAPSFRSPIRSNTLSTGTSTMPDAADTEGVAPAIIIVSPEPEASSSVQPPTPSDSTHGERKSEAEAEGDKGK